MARRPPPSTAGEALCLQVLLQRTPQQTEKHLQLWTGSARSRSSSSPHFRARGGPCSWEVTADLFEEKIKPNDGKCHPKRQSRISHWPTHGVLERRGCGTDGEHRAGPGRRCWAVVPWPQPAGLGSTLVLGCCCCWLACFPPSHQGQFLWMNSCSTRLPGTAHLRTTKASELTPYLSLVQGEFFTAVCQHCNYQHEASSYLPQKPFSPNNKDFSSLFLFFSSLYLSTPSPHPHHDLSEPCLQARSGAQWYITSILAKQSICSMWLRAHSKNAILFRPTVAPHKVFCSHAFLWDDRAYPRL